MRKEFRARRLTAFAAALGLAAVLPACGGGGGGTTPSTVSPAPQPTRTLIGNVSFAVVGVPEANRLGLTRDTGLAALTLNESGTLEVVADWTFASNDIDIQLFRGACTQQLLTTTGCSLITQTTSATQKPERLTTNVTAGTYTLGFTNYGNTSESGVAQVYLTR